MRNAAAREHRINVAYCGPALSGRTTSLYAAVGARQVSETLLIAQEFQPRVSAPRPTADVAANVALTGH